MRKIILKNTSTEEKQKYENTWGEKQTPIHQKSSLSQIIRGKREEEKKKGKKTTFLNLTLQTSKENQKQLTESDQTNFSILSQKKY